MKYLLVVAYLTGNNFVEIEHTGKLYDTIEECTIMGKLMEAASRGNQNHFAYKCYGGY